MAAETELSIGALDFISIAKCLHPSSLQLKKVESSTNAKIAELLAKPAWQCNYERRHRKCKEACELDSAGSLRSDALHKEFDNAGNLRGDALHKEFDNAGNLRDDALHKEFDNARNLQSDALKYRNL